MTSWKREKGSADLDRLGVKETQVMNIFGNLYMKASRGRFRKEFKPLVRTKKANYLISVPDNEQRFARALNFLDGLKRSGTVFLLASRRLEPICARFKKKAFTVLYYENDLEVLSSEYKKMKSELGERPFDTIIELNTPVNLSLPYLVPAEMRICFYDASAYPYYNFMIKGTIVALCEFFRIGESNPKKLFQFSVRQYNKLIKQLEKRKPILLVNGAEDISWEGDKIIVGKTLPASSPELYEILYFCDAYYGNQDVLFEFAKVFEKKVLTA
jgi:hypothetical protein